MDAAVATVLFNFFAEMEGDIEREHQRQSACRRGGVYFQHLCQRRGEAWHYCVINATLPVLQRYFANEDTHPHFRLNREAIQQLLVALKTERQHRWGPTLENLVFLLWLASGSAYRVVTRVFDVPLRTVHRVIHRMADEVVALLPQFVYLPRSQEEVVTACVILHNICVGVGDELEEAVLEEDNQPPAEHEGGESWSGAAWHAALANEVSSLQEAPVDHDYFAQVNTVMESVAYDHLLVEAKLA